MTLAEVEGDLHASMGALIDAKDSSAGRRLLKIEASVWQTFQALPKNEWGRLGPRGVRHAVHQYFARVHGWLLVGLEPHGMLDNVTEVHDVSILQDKAPHVVEALLEARSGDRGLALSDIIVMIAELERLIFDESRTLLDTSYELNGQSPIEDVNEENLKEVISSYLLLFGQGAKGDQPDAARHQAIKAFMAQNMTDHWAPIVDFGYDAVSNFAYARHSHTNPFGERRYSFTDATKIAEGLAHGYGRWQDAECRQMKSALMELDPRGTGRLPLSVFYSQPPDAAYQFSESVDYLRQTAALDETGRSVRIVNYLLGPSNCIAASAYYSICCLNECEGLVNDLEDELRAPTAPPERLLELVGNLSSSSVDAPRFLPAVLGTRLRDIAGRHGGSVPIHGRLFAQWLHLAFPYECPYPAIVESADALTQSQWDAQTGVASQEERTFYIEDSIGNTTDAEAASLPWSDEEVLPAQEMHRPRRTSFGLASRLVVAAAMAFALIRASLTGWRASTVRCVGAKNKDCNLPLYC